MDPVTNATGVASAPDVRTLAPAFSQALPEHDAIEACFDEERQSMLEASAEPAVCAVFSPANRTEVRNALGNHRSDQGCRA
jgi:hypothetical protein